MGNLGLDMSDKDDVSSSWDTLTLSNILLLIFLEELDDVMLGSLTWKRLRNVK